MEFPDPYSNILGVSVSMFLDEINIWIMRWNKADCPGQWGWAHPMEGLNRIKGDKGEFALSAWLSSAAALVFSYLWTWTQAGTTQMSEAHALPPQLSPSWISSSHPAPITLSLSHCLPSMPWSCNHRTGRWSCFCARKSSTACLKCPQTHSNLKLPISVQLFFSAWWQFNPVAKGKRWPLKFLIDSIKELTHLTRNHTAARQYFLPLNKQIQLKNKQAGRDATFSQQSNVSPNI